jgi:hypothetical protein
LTDAIKRLAAWPANFEEREDESVRDRETHPSHAMNVTPARTEAANGTSNENPRIAYTRTYLMVRRAKAPILGGGDSHPTADRSSRQPPELSWS